MTDEQGKNHKRDLLNRTKAFAIRIVRFYATLPKQAEAQVMGKQLLRSGTSVGAHYREASRARSRIEFISKIEVGLQELEESIYWLELLADTGIVEGAKIHAICHEADQLMAILVSSARTTKQRA
ncbi:MAG: four helix bundle protein [Nitrospiraceae bacterium]